MLSIFIIYPDMLITLKFLVLYATKVIPDSLDILDVLTNHFERCCYKVSVNNLSLHYYCSNLHILQNYVIKIKKITKVLHPYTERGLLKNFIVTVLHYPSSKDRFHHSAKVFAPLSC